MSSPPAPPGPPHVPWRSGAPSGVRAGRYGGNVALYATHVLAIGNLGVFGSNRACAATGRRDKACTASAATIKATAANVFRMFQYQLVEWNATVFVPRVFEQVGQTLMFEELRVRVLVSIQRHADLPWSREHLWILDRDLVEHVVGPCRRVPLDDVQGLAVKVARTIEPRLIREVHDVDDQRIAIKARPRVSHEPFDGTLRMRIAVHVGKANRAQILVEKGDLVALLHDLKRVRHVRDPRDPGQKTFALRIERGAILEILLPLLERRGLVGDRAALDNAAAGRHAEARVVIFEIPCGCVEDLPD